MLVSFITLILALCLTTRPLRVLHLMIRQNRARRSKLQHAMQAQSHGLKAPVGERRRCRKQKQRKRIPPTICKNRKSSYIRLRNGRMAKMMMMDITIVACLALGQSPLYIDQTFDFTYSDPIPPVRVVLLRVVKLRTPNCKEIGQYSSFTNGWGDKLWYIQTAYEIE